MTAAPSRPRWIVLEPGLRDEPGHQRSFALALPEAAAARGLAVEIYGGVSLPGQLARRIGAVPLFRTVPVRGAFRNVVAGSLYRFIRSSRDMAQDLSGPNGPRAGPDDVVLVPTAYPWLLSALGDWLRRIAPASRPRLAVTFHEGEGLFVRPGAPITLDQAQIRYALAALEPCLPRARLVVTATTRPLVERLSALIERPVAWCPVGNPVDQFATERPAAARRGPKGGPRIAIVGTPRFEKGIRALGPIVAGLLERLPTTQIFVQAHETDHGDPIPSSPAVLLHRGDLNDAQYLDALTGAAIVLMPYNPGRYRARVSGVFVDAVAAGCVVVVPPGTWMAQRTTANRASGIVCAAGVFDGIVDGAARAAADLDALSAKAMAIAPRWRAAVGPGPYLARIERLLRHPPVAGGAPDDDAS